jgi:ubiquinone biosynthesis monooxygenase Coq7
MNHRSSSSPHRHTSLTDALIGSADAALRTVFSARSGNANLPDRALETQGIAPMNDAQKTLSGALMRVNHVGEVCAQALYNAQAFGARAFSGNEVLAQHFEAAGKEEGDHLAWTRMRIDELGGRPSLLNPLWYAGAFGLGLLASRMGERVSLGFVVETERQVEAHLAQHMERLPANDLSSRALVARMKEDEARHAREAQHAGAAELPLPAKLAMKAAAKVMTTVAHRI